MSVLLLGRVTSAPYHIDGDRIVVHLDSAVSRFLILVPDAGSVPSWIDP